MGYSDEFYRRRKKLREERQPGESEYKGETGVRLPLPSYAPHDYNEDRFPNLPEYHPAKYTPLVENPYMRPEPPKPAITPTQLGSRVGQAAFDKFKAMYSAPREDFSLGKLGTGILEEGLHAAAKPFSATMAALEGLITKPIDYLETGTTEGPVTDSGLFHRWDQAISEDLEQARKKNAANLEAGGTGAKIANTVGVGTIAALPQLVAALGTGGASKAIDAGANMPGITGTIRNAIKGTKENPMFWTSYFQTVGEEYQEALNDGASELEAALRALGSGAANAAVEVGGGIESLPNELQGDKYTIKKWVEDMIDEGREEVAQGIISRATQNLFYGKDNPLYSVSDPDAVVNPMTAAQEFAGGAAVGGILAGAGGLGSNIVNRGRFQKPAGIGNYTPSEVERFNITPQNEIVEAISDVSEHDRVSMYQDPATGDWMYGKPPAPHRPSEVEDANAFQEERPRVRIPGNIPMENIVKDVSDNSQKAVDHIELLNQGKRVPDKDFRPDELDQLGDVGIDANFNVFNPNPDEHISQRDPADLGNRKVNAFQYDNPAVHDFFKGAAEQLVKDAEISASEPAGRRRVKGPQGVQYVNEILESASIRDAMDMGLSRSQIVKAAQDLIADKGQENNAAAKRLELVLDKMLSNGYKTIEGDVVGPNQAYIDTKKQIPGYVEREPLPLGTDNIVGTTEPPLNLREDTGKPVVDAFTAQLGKAGQSVVGDMYSQRGQLNESEANSWTRAMGAYYSAGQAGVDIGLVPSLNREYSSFVTPAEAQAAYLAGQADAVKEAPATAEDSSVVEERPAPAAKSPGPVDDAKTRKGSKKSYRVVSDGEPVLSEYTGYAMFADDMDSVAGGCYGDTMYTVDHSNLVPIEDLTERIVKAWNEEADEEFVNLPTPLEYLADTPAEEIAAMFNPADIVDSADAWDNPDLVTWAFDKGVFEDVPGVKTADGALVFDADLATLAEYGEDSGPSNISAPAAEPRKKREPAPEKQVVAENETTTPETEGDKLRKQLRVLRNVRVDGLVYDIKHVSDAGYSGIIFREGDDPYITDARNRVYTTTIMKNRDDVVEELVAVAENNGFLPGEKPRYKVPEKHVSEQETAADKKEDTNGTGKQERPVREDRPGRGSVEEVPDRAAVSEPEPGRDGAGGVLGDGAPASVREDDAGQEPVRNPERGGRPSAENAGGTDAGGSDAGPGVGTGEGGIVQPRPRVTEQPAQETSEETTEQQIETKRDLAEQEDPKGENFNYAESRIKIPATPKDRYAANVKAVKLLHKLTAEARRATPDEQKILAKYTGWGGVAGPFDFSGKNTGWAKEREQLKKLLTEEEYKTAKDSILDSYYTDPAVIQAMYKGLASLGFKGGRMLEPSAGVGRFIGALPKEMTGSINSWTAVELDKITGSIAKYLYPNADVRVQGYEEAKIPDNYMDVVIGNVPFGSFPVADRAYPNFVSQLIHNYFIAKSLDKVRPGGILCVLTSSGTMDAAGRNAVKTREFFSKKADLIGAIRLPNTAFQSTGTKVVSDILVFKKRAPGTPYTGESFFTLGTDYLSSGGRPVYGARANEYFHNHPEMILGTPAIVSGRHGAETTYNPLNVKKSLPKQIEDAFKAITAKMDYPVKPTQEEVRAEIKENAKKGKEGGIVRKGDKIYKNAGGELVEVKVAKKNVETVGDIINLRDAARALMDAQLDGAPNIETLRKQLNTLYDTFVKKHGSLNKNIRLIRMDSDAPFILSLENYDKESRTATKAEIFTKNTVSRRSTATHADSVEEGLIISMNETGTVDLTRIAGLTGMTQEEAKKDLFSRNLAYLDRNGDLQTTEQYLSGNVRAKLRDAEALAESNPEYERNVAALKKAIPPDISPDDIKVRLGATWVPDEIYTEFVSEILGGVGYTYREGQRVRGIEIKYNAPLGTFYVKINDPVLKSRPANTTEWGTPDAHLVGGSRSILSAALNNKSVSVRRKVGDSYVLDKQATIAAQEKMEKLVSRFQEWIWADKGRREQLAPLYNDVFNNMVTPIYNGENLTVDGMNPAMPMRPHQLNAVQRIINSGGNTLLAHMAGAGKTYEMAAAAMKLRQLGVVKKPVFVAPKHLVAQWGNEFLSYFPAAKILVLDEKSFDTANRKLFANKIATGDYDAVIMSYEQFGKIPMSKESQEEFFQVQLDALEEAILESKREAGKDPSLKDMVRSKRSFEAKLKKLADMKKDEGINFEAMGIDALFVDEAHNFKNLFYITKMDGVTDLGSKEGADRSFDLYMKVRYLQKLNSGRGIVFATATPVMNSVVELYTMQRYLQGDLLESMGISNFDAWVAQFGEVRNVRKIKPGGNGYEIKQSLSKYKNMAELQQMFRAFSDVIVDPSELPYLRIPGMKGGKRHVVEVDPSEFQAQFMDELGKRADRLRGAGKGGEEDHIFKIMHDGDSISYSQRFIDPSLPYEENGKIMTAAQKIYEKWQETEDNKGAQLVFCDRGTPGGTDAENGVNIYADLKNVLVGMGIPAEQIAFIHEADTDVKKTQLFKDVNEGKVRVLVGSTQKMGTGMNAQRRIAAIHELNAPARPGDLEQNERRGLRQGNMYDEVEIFTYVTKKTFDARKWDNLKRKATFIHQVMAGDYNGREAEGDGDLALSAAEISAIASDNPLIIEQFEISEKIAEMESLERSHAKEVSAARVQLSETEHKIKTDEVTLRQLHSDLKAKKDVSGGNFTISINGKNFTERKAAGEALVNIAKKKLDLSTQAEETYEVGSFAGFKLLVTSRGDMLLRGEGQYRGQINMQDGSATIVRLQNVADRIGKMVKETEHRIAEAKAAIPTLKSTIEKPFDRAEELIDARVREQQIIDELNPKSERGLEALPDDEDDVDNMIVRTGSEKDAKARWSTERVGDENVEVKPISDIIAKIQHDFGINVTKGHIRGKKGTLGQYNKKNEGVRIKGANDLPTVAHELGHHLDNLYGLTKHLSREARKELHDALGKAGQENYPEKKWTSEGLAEYVRAFLTNRQKATLDYPVFTGMFLNTMNPTDRALVEQLADDMNAALSLDKTAESSIRSMEDADADFRTRKEKTWDWLDERYQKHVDALHAIKRFDDSVGSNVYTKASNSAYADAMAWNIVTGDLTDAHGQYVGPGLKTVLTGLDLKNRKQMKAFNEYLVVRHAPERMKEGMQIFADPTKDTPEFCTRRQAELEAEHPEFEEIADRLYEFQKMFLQTWGVKMGLVSPGSAKKWAERWEYYVPFNRRVKKFQLFGTKRGFANQTSTIHKARGAGYDINDPLDNIINNMVKMVTAAVRNDVMRELTTSADKLGASATFLEKVPTPMAQHKISTKKIVDDLISGVAESELSTEDKQSVDDLITASIDEYLVQYTKKGPSGDVVTVLKDGKPEYWKINDRPLLESLTNMTPKTLGAVLGVYANVSRFMTSNITGNNVVWSIFSNAPRDLMTLFTYSKDRNAAKIFGGIAETYINKMKGGNADPLFKEYLAMGGGKSSAWSADRGLTKKVRKELTKKISLNPLDWISFVSDAVEMGPRYATYKIMRQNGATPEEAFYESTDVTVNFRRAGTVGRELNAYIPFYNAGLQGLDKFRRWITAADLQGVDRRKAVRGRMIGYVTASAALAAIAYIANNLDDEDKKEYQRLSTFIKNSFWVAPLGSGKYFAIPKPRELAVLSSFIESALEAYIGGNNHAFDDFYGYAVDNMTPKLLSSLLQGDVNEAVGGLGLVGTAHYIVANKDFLGRPIVSPALDRLLPRDQYTRRTSQIAKAVGQAFNISPVKLDFFMEQVLGGWWKYQRALFPVGEEYRDPTLGVHGSYIKDNLYSNDITRWLYDYADACGKESKSNPGSMEQAIRCKDAENMASFYSTFNKLAKDKKETEKLRSTRSTALTMIEDFRTAEEKNTSTPAVRAVRELCKDKGDTEYLPSVMPAVVKDGEEKEHILSAPEYLEYQTEYWGFYWDNVEENLSSGQSVTEKAAVCKAAKTVARERATERALSRKGLKSKGFFEKYPGIDDDDLTSFFSQRTVAREDDGKLKQDEVIDIIDDMDLTRERAYTLFRSMYQSDKNNPWA